MSETTDVVLRDEDGAEVHAPAEIEEWAENLRKRIAKPLPQRGVIKTPDSIIEDLEVVQYVAGQNVAVLREADRTRRAARRALAKAVAKAHKSATGKTVDDKKAEVEIATEAEADAVENAEIAYTYAKSIAELTETTKSAVQTQSKQVELTYSLAGSGRRP